MAGAASDYATGFGKGLRAAAKKQGPKDGEKAFKWLRRLVIAGSLSGGVAQTGLFRELAQLIAKYPEAFTWLERVLHYIK